MLSLLVSFAGAAPPPPMPLADALGQATIVAEAVPVRRQLSTLPDGESVETPALWTEYRVVRGLRGTVAGDVLRVTPNVYCMPSPQTYTRIGGEVFRVAGDGDKTPYTAGPLDTRPMWLLLAANGSPIQFIQPVTPENQGLIEAEVKAPGTKGAKEAWW